MVFSPDCIGTLLKVQFIQDSSLFRVQFRQVLTVLQICFYIFYCFMSDVHLLYMYCTCTCKNTHTCICKNDYIEIISKTIILILFGVLLVGRAHSTLVLSDI